MLKRVFTRRADRARKGKRETPQAQAVQQNISICAQDPTNAACVDCRRDPNNAACPKAEADTKGTAGFKKEDTQPGTFNTPDIAAIDPNAGANPSKNPYESAAANLVPNNTGGAIPGQGGQPQAAGQGKAGPGGTPGYDTDVMHGSMSGGYSAQAGNMNMESSSGAGGWSGYGRNPANTGGYEGMDLKKYLPGQANDPARKIAGLGSINGEIGPKYGDIFKRITDRVQVLCRFNRLLDCEKK